MNENPKEAFEGWAILELMGHRKLAGYVRQVEMFGAAMCRIDVPNGDGPIVASQFYSGGSIYCMTPTTEAIARAVAARQQPAPATPWEIRPALPMPAEPPSCFRGEPEDGGGDPDVEF